MYRVTRQNKCPFYRVRRQNGAVNIVFIAILPPPLMLIIQVFYFF